MTQSYKIILIIRGISCSIFILNPTHPPPLLKKIRRWLGMVACVLYVNDSSTFSYLFYILTMTSFAIYLQKEILIHPRHNNSRVLLISRHPSLVWCSHFALLRFFSIIVADESSIQRRQRTKPSAIFAFAFLFLFDYSMLLIKQQNERMNGSETS